MTTAARPTWAPAKGGEEQGGARIFGPSGKYSSRDLASHTKLKTRADGQDSKEDVRKRDLRGELDEKERRHFSSKDKGTDDRRKPSTAAFLEGPADHAAAKGLDADDSDDDNRNDDDDDSEDDDDDEDDTAALLAELERIKKERADEKLKKERLQQSEDAKLREAELIRGNPLLNTNGFSVKRRWDDDVVFRNQARGEAKTPKRFINDTIRSDFHRKFLNKYIK